MQRLAGWIRLVALLGIILPMAATQAAANTAECRNLEARLASVSHGGDRTKMRRYERAIISQRQQLERARNRQKNNGCTSFLSSIKPHCGEIRSTVAKMERNLLNLERTKNQLAGGNAAGEKARIRAEMSRKNCGVSEAAQKQRPTGLFARLFGTRGEGAREDKTERETRTEKVRSSASSSSSPGSSYRRGNHRTLCVRTCDGYFFPIAYASSPQNFDNDTKACMAMCPGTEVELYSHTVPDEETDAMVSTVTGKPYTELATAFRYRDPDYQRPKTCGCNQPKEFSIVAGELPPQDGTDNESGRETVYLPEPQSRPDPAEDPETRANREGGLTASSVAKLLAPEISTPELVATADSETEEKRIRVVGPTFLPDPEGAIDLRAPGRTELR
ncbi:MAG: DUF2865 domain-containing protein [Rhizobiaceae bacterium]|nr:DUF2865 domain-containing protein [Rhizobiaceae bacterium]